MWANRGPTAAHRLGRDEVLCDIFMWDSNSTRPYFRDQPLRQFTRLVCAEAFPRLPQHFGANPGFAILIEGKILDGTLSEAEAKRRLSVTKKVLLIPSTQEMWQHLANSTHLSIPQLKTALSVTLRHIAENRIAGLSRHTRSRQVMTVLSWGAFAGLLAGGAAWLSLASNLSALGSLQTQAVITVSAIVVLAVLTLVGACFGTAAWVSTKRDIRLTNRLFDRARALDDTNLLADRDTLPVAVIADEQQPAAQADI